MKTIVAALSLALLSGCSVLDAYLLTHYDPNEYQLITVIRTEAGHFKNQCDNAEVSKENSYQLSKITKLFANYSEYVPRNKDVIEASKSLHTIAQGLTDQYKKGSVSPTFCKIKFESVETSAGKMQQTIGGRPR